jgi:hypothetical protein
MSTPTKSHQVVAHAARFNPSDIRQAVSEVEGLNAKLAVLITQGVGTMACAYLFAAIALLSLPSAIKSGQIIIIVAWVAQTFLQLVLLSIIMVGQRVQSLVSDARAEKTFSDTETIIDRLDTHTAGGLHDVLAAIQSLGGSGASPGTGAGTR